MTQETKTKPAHEVRIGSIKAAVWAKTNANGQTRYDVSFCRLFKRKDSTKWEYSEYFNRDELPALANVIAQATAWVQAQPGNTAETSVTTAA